MGIACVDQGLLRDQRQGNVREYTASRMDAGRYMGKEKGNLDFSDGCCCGEGDRHIHLAGRDVGDVIKAPQRQNCNKKGIDNAGLSRRYQELGNSAVVQRSVQVAFTSCS